LKNVFKVIATLLFTSAIVALMLPGAVSAAAGQSSPNYPTSIAGYPVIYVNTADNNPNITPGSVVLTVLDNTTKVFDQASAVDQTTAATAIGKYLSTNALPTGWSIEIYGGPGATKESYIAAHNLLGDWKNSVGNIRLGPQTSLVQSDSISPMLTGNPTLATDENRDPVSLSNTVTFQSAYWFSPYIGTNQSLYSALLNNIDTNTGYFLQAGQVYATNGTVENIWSSQTEKFIPIFFLVPSHQGNSI
jgi:hypothetical protein